MSKHEVKLKDHAWYPCVLVESFPAMDYEGERHCVTLSVAVTSTDCDGRKFAYPEGYSFGGCHADNVREMS